jgi:hypothetical protein
VRRQTDVLCGQATNTIALCDLCRGTIFLIFIDLKQYLRHSMMGTGRAIQSVLFKQPQLQIARAYTLLPAEPGQADDELRF